MNIPNHPSYGQICRRLSRLAIDSSSSRSSRSSSRIEDDDDDGDIVIAIDSTGIKVANRGQWLRDKWNISKKGYLKIHVAVNVKTKEILSLEVTDEKVHDDAKVMDKLVEHILKNNNNNININSVLADGSYDSNKNFKYLYEKKILPGIKIRKNSITSTKNTNTRNKEGTSQQQQYFDRWKKKRKYGHRWMAETAFSL